jgi:hypothetical protein
MIRTACILIASGTLTSIFSTSSLAADPGFYVTAAMGRVKEDPTSIGANFAIGFPPTVIVHIDPERVQVDESDVAWSVAVGYRLNPYFAAEVEYIDFGSTEISELYVLGPPPAFPFPSELTLSHLSKVQGPAMSVLASLPVGKKLAVFLRAGALFADRELEIPRSIGLDDKFGSTVWLAGAGVDWSFANRWALRAEYQRTGKLDESSLAGETELERISLSALFRL